MNIRNLKPILRHDAKYDLQASLHNLVFAAIEKTDPIYKSCMNCANFREADEICTLYNARPPARVIAYACPKWEDIDEIPF